MIGPSVVSSIYLTVKSGADTDVAVVLWLRIPHPVPGTWYLIMTICTLPIPGSRRGRVDGLGMALPKLWLRLVLCRQHDWRRK